MQGSSEHLLARPRALGEGHHCGPHLSAVTTTDDPAIARRRVEQFRRELTGRAHFGEADRTFDEVMAAWDLGLTDRVARTTATRYLSSLVQLEPFLAGKARVDINGELICPLVAEVNAILRALRELLRPPKPPSLWARQSDWRRRTR